MYSYQCHVVDLVALILIRQSGFKLFPPTIFDKKQEEEFSRWPSASEHFNPISLTFQVKSLHRQKSSGIGCVIHVVTHNAGSRNLSVDVFDISVEDNFSRT